MPHARRLAFFTIAILLAAVPASATTNRVANGDCEQAGLFPNEIPHWLNDRETPMTYRVEQIGVNASAACVIMGANVLRSSDLFAVTAGEGLTVGFDVWEMRDDDANNVERVNGDSVVALEYVSASGKSARQLQFFCDEYIDLTDNGRLDRSLTCDRAAQFVHIQVPDPSIDCGEDPIPQCLKYNSTVPVPGDAIYARVLLGGSLTLSVLENIRRTGLETPTSITAFDNVFVGN